MTRTLTIAGLLAMALLAAAAPAQGALYNWDGTNTYWNTAHWLPGPVAPSAGNDYAVSSGRAYANSATFDGDSLTINSGGTLEVAYTGGSLVTLILNGGALTGGGGGRYLTGTMQIDADSTANGSFKLSNAWSGSGGFRITSGGTILGSDNGSAYTGVFTLDGTLNMNTFDLTVGGLSGSGRLAQGDIASTSIVTLNLQAGQSSTFDGALETGTTSLRIVRLVVAGSSTGKQVLTNSANSYDSTTVNGGILVADGDVAATGNSVVGSGSLTLSGGTLAVTAGHSFNLARLAASPTGALAGGGTFTGNASGLAVAPGLSVGTLTLDGDLTLGGTSTFEIASLASFDVMAGTAGKTVDFNGAALDLVFSGSFSDGDSFQIFQFDNYSGDFAAVNATGLAPTLQASFDSATGTVALAAVPEPATLAFLAAGGLAMAAGAIRRRRR